MSVNPQLDDLRTSIDAVGYFADCLTVGARLDAVSPADWPGILDDLRKLHNIVAHATTTAAQQARAAGVSWTAIGEALAMTKQGAQQKFAPPRLCQKRHPQTGVQCSRVVPPHTGWAHIGADGIEWES